MGGLTQRSIWESCDWVKDGREGGRQWRQEFWGGKQHHRLEITSVKLDPKILDLPFPR